MTSTIAQPQIRKHIHLLPEHLIDQIKAGEVIERPASLIKELVENSVDAGSKKIELHIIDNGLELISLIDDGEGMTFEDLPYAFCRHATSKIDRFEDLYKLHTYGFRGEALASMASISRLTCTSTPKEDLTKGGKIIFHGGEQKSLTEQTGSKNGTAIFIKDLFYNTPARLKFIKSKISEKNSLKKIVYSFVLSNPGISFTVKWDDKDKEIYPAVSGQNEMRKRVQKILFKRGQNEQNLIEIDSEYEGYRIKGFISKWSGRGGNGKSHFLFINKRLFTDKAIHQALLREMERYWGFGEQGHSMISLELPANEIDVNVHPNKTYIKFFKPGIVFSLVGSSIKKALQNEEPKRHPEAEHVQAQSFLPTDRTDLQEFSHSPFSSQPTFERPYQPFENAIPQQEDTPGPIGNGIYLWSPKESAEKYFIHLDRLLQHFIQDNVIGTQSVSIIPLLISEPFKLTQSFKEALPKLKSMGFEFDEMENNLFLLRTIPESLSLAEPSQILTPWFEAISNNSNELFPKDLSFKSFSPSVGFWKKLLSYSIHTLQERGILLSANEEFWKKVFYR